MTRWEKWRKYKRAKNWRKRFAR